MRSSDKSDDVDGKQVEDFARIEIARNSVEVTCSRSRSMKARGTGTKIQRQPISPQLHSAAANENN